MWGTGLESREKEQKEKRKKRKNHANGSVRAAPLAKIEALFAGVGLRIAGKTATLFFFYNARSAFVERQDPPN